MERKRYSLNNIIFFLLLLLINLTCSNNHYISILNLQCNYKENPVGILPKPQFSWILESEIRNQSQSAYHMLIADNPNLLKKDIGNIWDTKKVITNQSINIIYQGQELLPGKEYYWKVKVWDKNGYESGWSEIAKFFTGLFYKENWSEAKWISYEDMPDSLILVPGVHPWGKNIKELAKRRPVVPLFRKDFQTNKNIRSAYLFICGLGHYKASINGKRISDDFLSPGWTGYDKTCFYNTYDITAYIEKGQNTLGVIVGPGFYNVNNERYRKLLITYGMPKMICKIKITYSDGTIENIVTDSNWKTSPSPITYSSIYGGESYDAQLEQRGWNMPGFDDSNWNNALLAKDPGRTLISETSYPIRVMEKFSPVQIIKLGKDTFLYDFGQNASGIIHLKIRGQKGQTVKLIPGELLFDDHYVNQKATGRPYYFEYTLKGEGIETWQPLFTYYGFRYVQVEGAVPENEINNTNKPEIIELIHLHTFNSAPRVGEFTCSNELFNQVNKLILYAIQSNIQSVVTDCPHREKLGWLEQTYLMGGSIHYNFHLYHLYRKLVDDMINSQTPEGLIPNIAPEFVLFDEGFRDSPEWGSAGIILPWLLYEWYGDTSIMKKAWPMMIKYIQYLESKSDNYILYHGLGDWYDLGPERPGFAQLTPIELTATAMFYYDLSLMVKMARILNLPDDLKYMKNLADKVKTAFNNKFFNNIKKVYSTGSQTAMAMPICIGLVNDNDREKVLQNLVDLINANDKALTAGDIGFHFLVDALTAGGESELIYEMNNRDDVPGYGYQIKNGATSLTESWNASEIVSNNHLMLGHLMEWFYKVLGGISQEENSIAYEKIIINPAMVGDISYVKTSYQTPYGLIKSEWEKSNNTMIMQVQVPVNTTAKVYIPSKSSQAIKENGIRIDEIENIEIIEQQENMIVVKLGSGKYEFIIEK
ncbi:MAG: family 78 glycoside hydrolase catalytic domain [Bacteroidales bacterium]|nr:family 78 glycoside hydrolase catalytic domain [Bacteroidales bacterium]